MIVGTAISYIVSVFALIRESEHNRNVTKIIRNLIKFIRKFQNVAKNNRNLLNLLQLLEI